MYLIYQNILQLPTTEFMSQLGNYSELWDEIFPERLFQFKTKTKNCFRI